MTRSSQPDAVAMPVNLPAERAVLGALIEDDSLFSEALELTAADFAFSVHQKIFEAMLQLRAGNIPLDYLTVAERLGNGPEMVAMIGDLITGCISVRSHVRHHVQIVLRKSRLRQLIRIGEWIEKTALVGDDPAMVARLAMEKLAEVERRG